MSHVGVIDIGKTNAKVAVVDSKNLSEIAVRTRPNAVLSGAPYPHFDIEGIWAFIKAALGELNDQFPLSAISITTHGATAALVDADGALTLPVLDYEFDGPDTTRSAYDAIAPAFAHSLTPRLPLGLNLGAQLFFQKENWPDAFERTSAILTYPQYWAFRLTGVLASELTSLGCHTGLWDFGAGDYSALVDRLGIRGKLPPLRSAFDELGPITPEFADQTGLSPKVPVYCGIHDSNASLLPHILAAPLPFAVVSTGTWVIVCAPGGSVSGLDESRDCLANIDALGRTVPSARFMGGREFSMLTAGEDRNPGAETVRTVLAEKILLLPSVVQGSGPFPDRIAQWTVPSNTLDSDTRYVVVSYYLAMMTAQCLERTSALGPVIVEGPFARSTHFLDMLQACVGRPIVANAKNATGTSVGAALLTMGTATPPALDYSARKVPERIDAMVRYASAWRMAIANQT